MIKRFFYNLKIFWYGLFYGMKGVENLITTNQKNQNGSVFEVSDEGGGGVFKDVLEQRVTQEVEELRYTSYKIANESKKYKYIGNGKVVKKNESQLTEKHGLIEESDNLPIILIQDNSLICEDVLTVLNEVNNKEKKKVFNDYHIKIKRSLLPRFLLEHYVKKLVLKQSDGNYVIDLYCSKYPSQFSSRKDKSFLTEIKKIKNREVRNSDVLDFEEISFITTNAWGVDDWFYFSFNDFEYYDIIEFDGNYIVRLGCKASVFMENILEKVYSKSAEEKYEKKEKKKNASVNILTYANKQNYTIQDGIDLDSLENINFSIDNNKN